MNQFIQKLLVGVAMLCLSFSASAYDFVVDGICYDIIDRAELTCGVSGITKSLDCSKKIVLPSQVSFYGDNLTVIRIMNSAFQETNIVDISLPNTCTSIGQYAFIHCFKLQFINIPDGVTSIESGAFENCTSLTQINIPDGVTSIGSYAFSNCTSLTQINIPDGVTSIGYCAFENCSSFTKINIPNGVTSIGDCVVDGCTSLTEISVKSTRPPFCLNFTSWAEIYEKCLLKVPIGSLRAYTCAQGWAEFRNIEECDFSGVEAIEGDKALSCVADNGNIRIDNKDENSLVRVYNIQGSVLAETSESVVNNLPKGLYIVTVENQSFKVSLR